VRKYALSTFSVNFGPQHPAAHGVLRLVLVLDAEVILGVDPHVGLLHRGTEKLMESKPYLQCLPYLDRLDYVSMMAQEHAFSMSVETLLGLRQLPQRPSFIRVIFVELTRILNHLLAIGCHALDVGALTPVLWCFEEREKLMFFYEAVSGARMHAAYIRPGGVSKDIPRGLLNDVASFCTQFPSRIDEIEDLLSSNRVWKQRLVNVGTVSYQQALSWGFTGVMLRGSGICWDLRKAQSYEIYSSLRFGIPTGVYGDCFDRYLCRVAEMRESTQLVTQCLSSIPVGPTNIRDFSLVMQRTAVKKSMQGLIRHFRHYGTGSPIPHGIGYTFR
jgi:NADH:ubiquinone oxidoreductase subunit D